MKSVGIDTCVVLRILTGMPEAEAGKAEKLIEQCFLDNVSVCISDLVVAETYHALIYHYEVPKKEAVKSLKAFLSSPMVKPTGHALSVLNSYHGAGAGCVDRLIRMDLLDHADEIFTFDKNFAKLENVTRLT